MLLQKIIELILSRAAFMMFFLISNVTYYSIYIRLTDRKRGVSFLP